MSSTMTRMIAENGAVGSKDLKNVYEQALWLLCLHVFACRSKVSALCWELVPSVGLLSLSLFVLLILLHICEKSILDITNLVCCLAANMVLGDGKEIVTLYSSNSQRHLLLLLLVGGNIML